MITINTLDIHSIDVDSLCDWMQSAGIKPKCIVIYFDGCYLDMYFGEHKLRLGGVSLEFSPNSTHVFYHDIANKSMKIILKERRTRFNYPMWQYYSTY